MFISLIVTFICAVSLAGTVLAQDVLIALPSANSNVTAGSSVTVKVDKPMSLSGSEEVAVVIGITSCTTPTTCRDVSDVLGDILYNGPYKPVLYDRTGNPYQNITVKIPSGYKGPVQLGLAHCFLLGAGLGAQLQFTNTTLNAVASH